MRDAAMGDAAGRDGGGTTDSGSTLDASGLDAPATAFVPLLSDDFEGYADGEALPYDAAGRSTASSEVTHDSSRAARMEIRSGDGGGFGQWGAVMPIAPALQEGSEIWVRLYVYWPASFEFSANPWMKFLRLHTRTADGSNGGYNDLYVDRADETMSVLRTIKEAHDVWDVYDGPSLPRDQWERYEMYLTLDDVSVDDGGSGRVRVWRDDELIFDRTDVPTIPTGGDVDAFYLFTYWNGELPPDNHCYVDDLVIATSAAPPPNVDGAGHRVIGTWPR